MVTTKATRQELRARRDKARERFLRSRKASKVFERQLRQVAKQVGLIVNGMAPKGIVQSVPDLTNALRKYSDLLAPWAEAVSFRMINEVSQRDERAWMELGREAGVELRKELATAPISMTIEQLLAEQIGLIQSIPLYAAERLQHLTLEGLVEGTRATEIAKEIERTTHVSTSKAMLIARTEITRTSGLLTQARAEHIGSEGYIWRTSHDGDVRKEHKKLEGTYHTWDSPPIAAEDGTRYHAGCGPNCRCWMEPILPDIIK